jgi:putative RecB family exonuclease
MAPNTALQIMARQEHLSYSRISTYLGCSLKYRLRYIDRLQPERLAIALPFGIAIHRALERHYHVLMTRGQPENLATLQELFVDTLNREIEATTAPVTYKKTMPDPASARDMGRQMLEVLHREGDVAASQILDVELPLSAELVDENNAPTGVKLIGVIDLLIQDGNGQLAVIDHKTAAQARTQATVDDDLQLSAYAYLLTQNRYVFPAAEIPCRLDVLRKLKTPKLEHHHTRRGAADRRRFVGIAAMVLRGIAAGIFIPCRSFLCGDCEYENACSRWPEP